MDQKPYRICFFPRATIALAGRDTRGGALWARVFFGFPGSVASPRQVRRPNHTTAIKTHFAPALPGLRRRAHGGDHPRRPLPQVRRGFALHRLIFKRRAVFDRASDELN